MRHSKWLAGFIIAAFAAPAQAQLKPPAEIKQLRIGFASYQPEDGAGRYKVGLWTPVYVKIKAGTNGIRPKQKDDVPYIQVETQDSANVATIFRTPFTMEPNEERYIPTFARPGQFSDIKVTVHIGDQTFNMPPFGGYRSLDLNTHLYVTLGERIADLQGALAGLSPRQQPNQQQQFNQPGMPVTKETFPRYAGFETDAELLPEHWFGYQGVDLLFLSTRDKDFLLHLAKDNDASRAKLKAMAQWIRRGGRLVISVSPRNADVLHQLLTSTVWQPPLPVVPPREGSFEAKRLSKVEEYASVNNKPFILKQSDKLAILEPGKMIPGAWDVRATEAGKPVIARMPYGLGSITYVAFPLDDVPFTTWDGRVEFLKQLITRLGPRVSANPGDPGMAHMNQQDSDVGAQLERSLDLFDVRVIPFGFVALFIILYILVVGPLDFILLKYVFKRLEWTWFTFPTVVVAVSIAAYYTAYAIKGSDLKINKVDIVDFDLRTSIDAKGQTKKASIYGNSFFTILSPRIQNYTVGIEPNPLFWGQNAAEPASADMLTWLGRPDANFGGMGRGGGQGFFRKPYRYNEDASGLYDVPIPVWTTKSFQATWEMQGVTPPVQVNLAYQQFPEPRLLGTIASKLPVDLEDAWLLYLNGAYPIEGGVPKGSELKLAFDQGQGKAITEWGGASNDGPRIQTAQGQYNPSSIVRNILFNTRLDPNNTSRNHSLRGLDLSWRFKEDSLQRDDRIREAILVARVKFVHGSAESLTTDVNNPLPTNLWLGALPTDGGTRPTLAGILAQDTFVRFIVPVRPKE